MSDVGTVYQLDIAQAEAALDRLGLADANLRNSISATTTAANAGFVEAAKSATAYSDRLAAANAELRASQAATREVQAAVAALTAANRDLAEARKASTSTAEYNRLTKLIADNNAEIKKARAIIAENKIATDQERASVQAVVEARRQEQNQTKLVTAAAKEAAAAAKQEAQAAKEAANATESTGKASSFLQGILGSVGSAFAGIFAINKLKQLAEDVIETTAEFQRLEAVLTTINDGDSGKAQRQFAELRAFTLRNPFEIKEVTEGYVTLRNVGINPTIEQLQSLADLAAASGKSFDTVTSSLLGATTGRFVQLKQFGITAKQQGDTVAFTFRGVTTVVEKTQKAISDYVFSLGELNSVQGATERIMETTGGRITNLKDSLTELFNVIGEGTDGPVNKFIAGLTNIATGVREFLKSSDQKAKDELAKSGFLQEYSTYSDLVFAQITAKAKKSGEDVGRAIRQYAAEQTIQLRKQLAEAEKAVEALPAREIDLTDPFGAGVSLATNKLSEEERVRRQQKVETLKGEIGLLQERTEVALKGGQAEEALLGRINALRALIAANEKARDEAPNTKAGNAERIRLIALLKEEGKELDILLGKEEKRRKAREINYEAQLRALLQERETLRSLAAKAAEASADDAAGKAQAVFEEALRQVDVVKSKLEQRENDLRKQAAKAGGSRAVAGLGEKADGQVDGVQAQQLTTLRLAALDKYYADLYKITAEREQRLFDLREGTNEKEIEAVDRKYAALLAKAKDAQEREAIELARQRDQLALKAEQEQQRISRTATLATNNAQAVGQVFGAGTGVSVFEAARAEKQALLDIEKQAAEDSLNNTLNKTEKEGQIERAALRAQLARIAQQQKDLDRETKRSDFSIYKLVLGDRDSPELRKALDDFTSNVLGSLSQITQAEQAAAATKASAATQHINELQSQLNTEVQLNREGAASNIKGLQDQLVEQKRIRKEALADQRKAAQQQVIIDALTQASSVTTAAAEALANLSGLGPYGWIAGLAAAGLIVGGFVAAKVKAYQAASEIGSGGSFFKGGLGTTGYTGDGDPHQESCALGPKDYTYHRQEFIHDHETTAQYHKALFAPLHQRRPQDIDWNAPQMRALLPDLSLPATIRAERAEAHRIDVQHSFAPMRQEFDGLRAELSDIKETNARMAAQPIITPTADGHTITNPVTGSVTRVRFE